LPEKLFFHGILLFLFGLINGALIPKFLNPRMGLSAHLAGVQNGLSLVAFGVVWSHAIIPFEGFAYWMSLYSMYGIWVGLLLAGIWGTSKSTPIAGKGFSASLLKENIATFIIKSASVAAVVATAFILVGLYNNIESIF
jgi:(hydroxyamino)benzene mutase